jgi:hypothetical protein
MSDTAREKARVRQAKRRANLKNKTDSYKKYLEKDRNRKAVWKRSLNSTELEEHKLKERIRMRDRRVKAAASNFVAGSGPSTSARATPYRSTQALGKALKRAQQSLPASPSKRLCVVQSLAKKAGLSVEGSPSSSNSDNPRALNSSQSSLHGYAVSIYSWTTPQAPIRTVT